MSQNVTKCYAFSNLWYKATFTFYPNVPNGNSSQLHFHRESSLYLPCRFSQLSTEIPGDVLFRRMDPPKLLNLVRKSKKFTDKVTPFTTNINTAWKLLETTKAMIPPPLPNYPYK